MSSIPFVLVTGMSGSGKTFALKVLEDLGYGATDNLPLPLIDRLIHLDLPLSHPIALGVDIRTQDFGSENFLKQLETYRQNKILTTRVLYLDCDDEVLELRYNESRRRHPLVQDHPVIDGIKLERRLMAPLKDVADLLIDTTHLKTPDLKRLLRAHFALDVGSSTLALHILSFSYRHGLPREADIVMDMRFLDNPHYQEELKHQSGRDQQVADFIGLDQDAHAFLHHFEALLKIALPKFEQEGRHYLTIALGCTGGQHRSVYMAEQVFSYLKPTYPNTLIHHRDLASPSQL